MFFESRIFRGWYVGMMAVWLVLFVVLCSITFLLEHWHYPAIMLLGAFVAGLTPEGGGAVAFPVLSVFFEIDRTTARDFSLMIQSVGMTSASVWILTRKTTRASEFASLAWFVPVGFAGFVIGMAALQVIPVVIIQAVFLSLITTFALAYVAAKHRGSRHSLLFEYSGDRVLIGGALLLGGMCASLFGTGADIVLYTVLVTRLRMDEKVATHMSIMLMAALSVLGSAYRLLWDGDVTHYQVQTWLCAFPVVLLMAPFGSFILQRLNTEWMLRAIVALNLLQIAYFNWKAPSVEKLAWTAGASAVLFVVFWLSLARMGRADRNPDKVIADN